MHELKMFSHKQFGEVRTIVIGKTIWFVGMDISKAMNYRNGSRDIKRHVDSEYIRKEKIHDGVQHRAVILINEQGVYNLVLGSKMPTASKFKKWITHTILPNTSEPNESSEESTFHKTLDDEQELNRFLKTMYKISNENLELKNQVKQLAPKGQYYEAMMDSNLLVNFRTVAKQIGVRPLYFVHFLLDKRFVYRNSQDVLQPFQTYVHKGLFEIIEFYNGGHKGLQTLITPKGRDHFLQLYLDGEMDLGK